MTGDSTPSISSKEIANLVEKRHDNVKRTIETLSSQGVISHPQFEDGIKSANGITEKVYAFSGTKGKRDNYVVVAQLSPSKTYWQKNYWLIEVAGLLFKNMQGAVLGSTCLPSLASDATSALHATRNGWLNLASGFWMILPSPSPIVTSSSPSPSLVR